MNEWLEHRSNMPADPLAVLVVAQENKQYVNMC